MPESNALADKRIFGLDLLRACAVLLVVGTHAHTVLPDHPAIGRVYSLLVPDGVTLFFVLSGYLIGGILLKMLAQAPFGAREVGRFWLRRWLRTLPSYYLVLAMAVTIGLVYRMQLPPVLEYVLFIQNFAWPHPGFFAEAWSLAVEEWFYLLLPPLLLASVRLLPRARPDHVLLGWTLACLLLVPLFRAWVAQTHGYINFDIWDNWLRKQVVTRFDAIAWGVLGAWLHAYRAALWQRHARPLLVAGVALLCITRPLIILGPFPAYMNYLHLSLEPFAVLLLLPALSGMRAGMGVGVGVSTSTSTGPWHRAVRFVSDISYPLYLVNLTLIRFGLLPRLTYVYLPAQPGVLADLILYVGYWVLCFLFAWLLHRCWEAPIMRWRDRHLRREAAFAREI